VEDRDSRSPVGQEAGQRGAEDQGPSAECSVPTPESRGQGSRAADPAPSPKKPKRKYRSSDKVRASSPANLNQARKAYVFTPARKAASMKNLEKANAAPPEKRNRLLSLA